MSGVTSHHPGCFGCGCGNKRGLGLRPEWKGTEMHFQHVPPVTAEGGPGIAHGGYLSALADEVMSMVAAEHAGGPVMTRRVQVDFRAPAFVGVPLTVRAWVGETRRRSIVVQLETFQGEAGQTCFEARGVFLEVPRELWVRAMESRGRGPDSVDWSGGDPSTFLRWQMNGGLQEIFQPDLLERPLRLEVHIADADPAGWTIEADAHGLRTVEKPSGGEATFHGTFQQWQRLLRGTAPPAGLAAQECRVEGRGAAFTELAAALDYRRFA